MKPKKLQTSQETLERVLNFVYNEKGWGLLFFINGFPWYIHNWRVHTQKRKSCHATFTTNSLLRFSFLKKAKNKIWMVNKTKNIHNAQKLGEVLVRLLYFVQFWGHSRPQKATRYQLRSLEVIRCHSRSLEATWDHATQCHLRSLEATRGHLRSFEIIWGHLRSL